MGNDAEASSVPSPSTTKRLPAIADEVPIALLVNFDDEPSPKGQSARAGDLDARITKEPQLLVYLGTFFDQDDPSNLGLRIFLRQEGEERVSTKESEGVYHIISLEILATGFLTVLRPVTDQDKEDFAAAGQDLFDVPCGINGMGRKINCFCIDARAIHPDAFLLDTSHGQPLLGDRSYLSNINQTLALINASKRIRLFFASRTKLLGYIRHLLESDNQGYTRVPWNGQLPSSALPTWENNHQDRMVVGSESLFNVLSTAFHEIPPLNARNTFLSHRPRARVFSGVISKIYPFLQKPPEGKVYPVFLSVGDGHCVEYPFIASLLNIENTYAALNVIQRLLQLGIPAEDIGIVSFYRAQTDAYVEALQQCHNFAKTKGYKNIRAKTLEDWVGEVVPIAIVDFVRTANASGNLGLLSQGRRLQVALSLHQDGLVAVGDIDCAIDAEGKVTSSKLGKVLRWFQDHGRVVKMSNQGLPLPKDQQNPSIPTPYPQSWPFFTDALKAGRKSDSNQSTGSESSTKSNWRGAPNARASASESFARQRSVMTNMTNSTPRQSLANGSTNLIDLDGPNSPVSWTRHDRTRVDPAKAISDSFARQGFAPSSAKFSVGQPLAVTAPTNSGNVASTNPFGGLVASFEHLTTDELHSLDTINGTEANLPVDVSPRSSQSDAEKREPLTPSPLIEMKIENKQAEIHEPQEPSQTMTLPSTFTKAHLNFQTSKPKQLEIPDPFTKSGLLPKSAVDFLRPDNEVSAVKVSKTVLSVARKKTPPNCIRTAQRK